MPVDPVLIAETKAWLRKAAYDLRAASHSLTASPPLLGDVVFHCQQAAEKALKGFLMWNNIPFRKTHSLEENRKRLKVNGDQRPPDDYTVTIQARFNLGEQRGSSSHCLKHQLAQFDE